MRRGAGSAAWLYPTGVSSQEPVGGSGEITLFMVGEIKSGQVTLYD